jgi:hypothetical protein
VIRPPSNEDVAFLVSTMISRVPDGNLITPVVVNGTSYEMVCGGATRATSVAVGVPAERRARLHTTLQR